MVVLKSSDGQMFEVDEIVVSKSVTIKYLIEGCEDTSGIIPISNVTGKILALVINYCNRHFKKGGDNKNEDDLKTFDTEFVRVDNDILADLIMAANYLDIDSLLDLTSQAVADMIEGKTAEEIRLIFNIENDFSPEEEHNIHREHAWAFEQINISTSGSNMVIKPLDHLPLDLMTHILVRTRVKTIVRCLSVCKSWRTQILSPHFIQAHLRHQRGDLLLLRTTPDGEREFYSLHYDDADFALYARYQFPLVHPHVDDSGPDYNRDFSCNDNVYKVLGSTRGVICLTTVGTPLEQTYLWNPTVRKCLALPSKTKAPNVEPDVYCYGIGFGFDPKTSDFKVARIVDKITSEDTPLVVEIYSLSSNSWKDISNMASGFRFDGYKSHERYVSLNGTLYWVAYKITAEEKFYPIVLALNLGDEIFSLLETPTCIRSMYHYDIKLVAIQDALTLIHWDPVRKRCSVWKMGERGESWISMREEYLKNLLLYVAIWVRESLGYLIVRDGRLCSIEGHESEPNELGIWTKEGEVEEETGHIIYRDSLCCERYIESLELLDLMSYEELQNVVH